MEVIFIGLQVQTQTNPTPNAHADVHYTSLSPFLTSHTQVALRLAFHNIFLSKANLQPRDYVKRVYTASNHFYAISLQKKKTTTSDRMNPAPVTIKICTSAIVIV